MKIAIIDAEIIGKKKHRFPNLVCMKLSAYYKSKGADVELKTNYDNLESYDKVFISKVFTETVVPGEPEDKSSKTSENIAEWYSDNLFLKQSNIEYGGTGFFYDKAVSLPEEIEHTFPDYSLYDNWIKTSIENGAKPNEFEYYTKHSIGYATRGCFRKCKFCVNREYDYSYRVGRIEDFLDKKRPYICLLDDNFFACGEWKNIIEEIKATGKRFQFKQGLDERLLTPDIVSEICTWKYHKEFIFAFDDIRDKKIIEDKLKMIYKTCPNFKRELKFYIFCGYDRNEKYDMMFWEQDIRDLFERIRILIKYNAKPYVMRYEKIYTSIFKGFYSAVTSWCNQPALFKTFTFRMFAICRGMSKKGYKKYKRDFEGYLRDGGRKGATWRDMESLERQYPDIAEKYFDMCSISKAGQEGGTDAYGKDKSYNQRQRRFF